MESTVSMTGLACSCILSIALLVGGCAAESQQALSGEYLYANNCAACHGRFAEGDGPVAAAMRVTMPNLRNLRSRNNDVFPLDAVTAYVDGRDVPAAHGTRSMPVWGDVFGADPEDDEPAAESLVRQRIDAIIEFLIALQYTD